MQTDAGIQFKIDTVSAVNGQAVLGSTLVNSRDIRGTLEPIGSNLTPATLAERRAEGRAERVAHDADGALNTYWLGEPVVTTHDGVDRIGFVSGTNSEYGLEMMHPRGTTPATSTTIRQWARLITDDQAASRLDYDARVAASQAGEPFRPLDGDRVQFLYNNLLLTGRIQCTGSASSNIISDLDGTQA